MRIFSTLCGNSKHDCKYKDSVREVNIVVFIAHVEMEKLFPSFSHHFGVINNFLPTYFSKIIMKKQGNIEKV